MFTFQTARQIIFGPGTRKRLPALVESLGGKPLIVTGRRALKKSGRLAELRELMPDAVLFAGVEPEPTLGQVERGRQALREAGARVVVAVGGGSVLDAGKAIGGLAASRLETALFFHGREKPPPAGRPVIAVPTTAGSGAEVTPNAVLTEAASRRKASIRGEALRPAAALVDPELTLGLPPDLTAWTGLDALTQAIESYLSNQANALTRPLSLEAARLIGQALGEAVAAPGDRSARADLALGALLAGIALANARLGLVHGLAHPLGAQLELPHGLACAVLLPWVLEFNAPTSRERQLELAGAVGAPAGESLVDFVRRLNRDLQVPADLAGRAAGRLDRDAVIKDALASGSTAANPRPATAADIAALLDQLLK